SSASSCGREDLCRSFGSLFPLDGPTLFFRSVRHNKSNMALLLRFRVVEGPRRAEWAGTPPRRGLEACVRRLAMAARAFASQEGQRGESSGRVGDQGSWLWASAGRYESPDVDAMRASVTQRGLS